MNGNTAKLGLPLCGLLLISLLSLFSCNALSKPLIKFRNLWLDDGLPSRTVWTIKQNKDGLLWLGTTNGLAVYDGYEFNVYRSDNGGKNAIVGDIVRSLEIQPDGIIWIGTHSGLSRFDQKKKQFVNYQHDPKNINSINSNIVYALSNLDDNQLWLGTDKGIDKLNKSTGNVKRYNAASNQTGNFPRGRVNAIVTTRENTTWVATNSGLAEYDEVTDSFVGKAFPNSEKLVVKSLLETSTGRLLIGTSKGLYFIDLDSMNQIQELIIADDFFVYSMTEDESGTVWLGTIENGLYSLNNGKISGHFKYSKSNTDSLPDRDVYSLYRDFNNTIWIGTFNGGLSQVNPRVAHFKLYDDSPDSLGCLRTPVIYGILEGAEYLWLGTQNGLARVSENKKDCNLILNENSHLESHLRNEIVTLKKYDAENVIFSTSSGVQVSREKDVSGGKPDSRFPGYAMYDHSFDKLGNQLIATEIGIFQMRKGAKKFEKLDTEDGIGNELNAFSIAENTTGKNWIAADEGLFEVGDDFKLRRKTSIGSIPLEKTVHVMYRDRENKFWVGINNIGLFAFNSDDELVHSYRDAEKLNAILGFGSILESATGELWISSINGISRVNPKTGDIYNYHSSDGLQNGEFVSGSRYQSLDGTMYFGGRKGLNVFNPQDIVHSRVEPKVNIRKLFLFNQEVEVNQEYDSFKIEQDISSLSEITLSYKNYLFGFEFSAVHYDDPMRNQYAYMLEGYDNDWIYTGAKYRRATYNNLPAGKYNFLVKAASKHGVWTKNPRELKVIVLPPFWKSTTAYVVYIILIVLSVYLIVAFRTRSLRKRSHELEQSVKRRTQELAEEKDKVEQLLSRKNEEFANVSHEFRTPLTLILGPVAQLLQVNKSEEEVQRLNVVQRNGYRLLRMVDQLLNMETFRVKAITQKSPQTCGSIIRLIAEAFADLAAEKGIALEIEQIDEVNFEFTPDALDKIILNLLSNAVKYTKAGGRITLKAFRNDQNELEIVVSDTGIGIPEDNQSDVFDRFKRVIDENSESVTGAGIGLALVKELVESHGGQIQLKSAVGKGTSIGVKLPIINEVSHVNNDAISNEEVIAMEMMSISGQGVRENTETIIESGSNNQTRVLVIEDNLDMRQYIVDSIQDNYSVLSACDGQEGVEIAQREVPDIIISDIMMPKLDGYEVTKKLRQLESTNHIPIILLTAKGDRESKLKGWQEKADEYLTKPFDVEELLIRIKNLLEIRDILRQRFSEIVFRSPFEKTTKNTTVDNIEDLPQDRDSHFIEKINAILNESYHLPDLRIVDIAAKISMSDRQLLRKFKAILNMTCNEYLKRYRLQRACERLKEGQSPSSIWLDVGFTSHSHFGKCFKAQYQCSPSEYQVE